MPAYLALADFRLKVEFLNPEDVDLFESRYPGYIADKLAAWSDAINSRLCKRYSTPFTPTPPTVARWLVDLTTQSVLNRRGYRADDPEMIRMQARFDEAQAEIKEAASSEVSLFGLPAGGGLSGDGTTAIGGPLFYTERSPFVSADVQEFAGRLEDEARSGTFGGS